MFAWRKRPSNSSRFCSNACVSSVWLVPLATVRRANRLDFIELKFARHFFNQMRRNRAQMIHVRVDQRMLAQQIHDAGNSARIHMNRLNRFLRENRLSVGSRDSQPFGDISERFLERQRATCGIAT